MWLSGGQLYLVSNSKQTNKYRQIHIWIQEVFSLALHEDWKLGERATVTPLYPKLLSLRTNEAKTLWKNILSN